MADTTLLELNQEKYLYGTMYPQNQSATVQSETVNPWPAVATDLEEKLNTSNEKFSNGGSETQPSYIPAETVNHITDNLSRFFVKMGGYYDAKTVHKNMISSLFTYNPPNFVDEETYKGIFEADEQPNTFFASCLSTSTDSEINRFRLESAANLLAKGIHTEDDYNYRVFSKNLKDEEGNVIITDAIINSTLQNKGDQNNLAYLTRWPLVDIDLFDDSFPKESVSLNGRELHKSIPIRAFDGTMRAKGPDNMLYSDMETFTVSYDDIVDGFVNADGTLTSLGQLHYDKINTKPKVVYSNGGKTYISKWLSGNLTDDDVFSSTYTDEDLTEENPSSKINISRRIIQNNNNNFNPQAILTQNTDYEFISEGNVDNYIKYVDSQNVVTKKELDKETFNRNKDITERHTDIFNKMTSIVSRINLNDRNTGFKPGGVSPDTGTFNYDTLPPHRRVPAEPVIFSEEIDLELYKNKSLLAFIEAGFREIKKHIDANDLKQANNLSDVNSDLSSQISSNDSDIQNLQAEDESLEDRIEALETLTKTDGKTLDTIAEIAAALNDDAAAFNTLDKKITDLRSYTDDRLKEKVFLSSVDPQTISGNVTFENSVIMEDTLNVEKTTTLNNLSSPSTATFNGTTSISGIFIVPEINNSTIEEFIETI